jgi:hypothetical protein
MVVRSFDLTFFKFSKINEMHYSGSREDHLEGGNSRMLSPRLHEMPMAHF